jgi:hypothetical protein
MRRLLVILVLATLAACGAPQGEGSSAGGPARPGPSFKFTTFGNAEFDLAEQRGSPVVLNFWESW